MVDCCRFCQIARGHYTYPNVDEPLMYSDNYLAIASIGALTEGWSLVVPITHTLSLKSYYEESHFAEFTSKVLDPLVSYYGPIVAFEHGARYEGSVTACGTNHAHLHLVPLCESLEAKVLTYGLNWKKCKSSEISAAVGEKEYLFCVDLKHSQEWNDPLGLLHIVEEPISQFFRRVIADTLRDVGNFDYKQNPRVETSEKTKQRLEPLAVSD